MAGSSEIIIQRAQTSFSLVRRVWTEFFYLKESEAQNGSACGHPSAGKDFMEVFVCNSTGTGAFSTLVPVEGRSLLSSGERPELQNPQRKGISATELWD